MISLKHVLVMDFTAMNLLALVYRVDEIVLHCSCAFNYIVHINSFAYFITSGLPSDGNPVAKSKMQVK